MISNAKADLWPVGGRLLTCCTKQTANCICPFLVSQRKTGEHHDRFRKGVSRPATGRRGLSGRIVAICCAFYCACLGNLRSFPGITRFVRVRCRPVQFYRRSRGDRGPGRTTIYSILRLVQAMQELTIRPFRSLADARPQYELWLRATESLPRAWRSSLRNVEHQLGNGERYPNCRLYAERPDGTFAGYIGNHPPFEWVAEQHGPPARSLGWAIPFGFPWTDPLDTELERALYDAMIQATPATYAESRRDFYIQRFRESWTRPIVFLQDRGWRLLDRLPLYGRTITGAGLAPQGLTPVKEADLEFVSRVAEADPTAIDKPSTDGLVQRFRAGWIVSDSFYRLEDSGAFALEVRGQWAAVTLFYAGPDAWEDTLRAAAAQASALSATEMYFTIDSHESARRSALERNGFGEVDAGVYYIRDAD